ncbi:MAG: hypothetical protein IKV57_06080 [Clostridia bacterium]|nr:hypothetical protein [Clostridia bacterium]
MVFLKILLGIVLFCVLIGAIPLRVRIRLEDEFTVLAGIGPLVLFRTPAKKKPVNLRDFTYKKHQKRLQKERAALLKKKQKKLESSARKEQKKQQKNEEKEKARQLEKTTAAANKKENKLEAILDIVSCVLEGLPKLFGGFKCRIYRLDVTAGGRDAAEAAKNFAILSQSMAYLLEFLDNKTRFVRPKPETVAVRVDFLLEKTRFEGDFYLQIRIGQILGPIFGIAFNCIKVLIRNH